MRRPLDAIDAAIVSYLLSNPGAAIRRISEATGRKQTATRYRLKKLEALGIIAYDGGFGRVRVAGDITIYDGKIFKVATT